MKSLQRFLTDRFEVRRILHRSEHVTSFVGNDRWWGRDDVFVKCIRNRACWIDRGFRESLARYRGLVHPLVENIYDAGFSPRKDFFYVRHYSAKAENPTSSAQLKRLAPQIVAACALLHSRGLVHGRIKPNNILVHDTACHVVDGGLPLLHEWNLDADDVHYCAPELLEGGGPTIETDLYSLGAVLYRAYSGRALFEDSSIELLRRKYANAEPGALSEVSDAPKAVSDVVRGLVSRNPRARREVFADVLKLFSSPSWSVTQAPLVGRERELQEAMELLSSSGRDIRLLVVDGEAGAGKTRLVEELRFRCALASGPFLIGRCFERENRQFEPFLQVISQKLERRDALLKRWEAAEFPRFRHSLDHLLSESQEEGLPAGLSAGKLVTDLAGATISLTNQMRRSTVVFEDMHWSDEGTLKVLEQILLRGGEANLCLVLTARSGKILGSLRRLLGGPTPAGITIHRISLKPLNATAAFSLAESLNGNAAHAARIVRKACGNPLFLEEYSRYHNLHSKSLPSSVEDVLVDKVTSLSKRLRGAIDVLSLFPKPTSLKEAKGAVASLVHQPEGHVDELIDAGILMSDSSNLRFRHDGIREAVYRRISLGRRRQLHRAVYDRLLQGSSDDEVVGYHAERAGMPDKAAHAYVTAADSNRQQHNYQTAAELFSLARECLIRSGQGVPHSLDVSYSRCLMSIGKKYAARKLLHHVVTASNDRNVRAVAYGYLADSSLEDPESSVALYRAQLNELPKGSDQLPRVLLSLSQAHAMAGEANAARRFLSNAERLLERAPDGAKNKRLSVIKGTILISLCDYSQAFAVLPGQADGELQALVLNNRAVCLEHLGQLDGACECQREALDLSRQQGLLAVELQSLANMGAFETKRGEFEIAATSFEKAESFSASMNLYREGNRKNLPLLAADHATLRMETGQYAEARKLFASAFRWLKRDRTSQTAIWVALRQAEFYTRTHEMRLAAKAIDSVSTSELLDTDLLKVEQALIEARLPRLPATDRLRLLDRALPITASLGTLYQRCRVLIEAGALLVDLGRPEEARAHLSESLRLARQHRYKPFEAKALLLKASATQEKRTRHECLGKAYRIAADTRLPEIAAECALRIGENEFQSKNLPNAREYLSRSVSLGKSLASELPARARNRYLRVPWRQQAMKLLATVEEQLPAPERLTLSKDPRDRALFKVAYETTMSLGAARGVEGFVRAFNGGIKRALKGKVTLVLRARDKIEFHAEAPLDDSLSKTLSKLYDKIQDGPFFGRGENVQDRAFAGSGTMAWIPLTSAGSRLGGLYINIGTKRFTETEIEFLTMIGVIGANALASILASDHLPSRKRGKRYHYKGIVGVSREIEEVCVQIEIAAGSPATVLIEGESGTGKELVARAIHENSSRRAAPMVTVDCGAIPETLIESEIFGSRRGSFTGATVDRPGLIESAHKGTLFLDEIANTSPALQAKLLRVLQEKEVRRLGDTKARKVDIRLVAATNANLEQLIEQGRFRQDLLFRLKVLHIQIPPLHERREDIPEIARVFLQQLNETNGTNKRFGRGTLDRLAAGRYPGNVRELHNIVERAYFSTTSGTIKEVSIELLPARQKDSSEVQSWFKDLTAGRKDFWADVHARYKQRDIPREQVIALMDLGLKATRGSYKSVAALFRVQESEYRRFMDFLRRNKCQPDFRPYRRL